MTSQPRLRQRSVPRIGRNLATAVAIRRIRWLLVCYVLIAIAMVAQLANIQLVHGDEYADRSIRQRERTIELPASRGRVYDRNGDILATSVDGAAIFVDPRQFATTDTMSVHRAAALLAPHVPLDVADIRERLTRPTQFAYLGRQLDWDVGQRVVELGIPGVGMVREPKRVYPTSGLVGQIIGFTGIDSQGLHGLEAQYDSILSGQPGAVMLERAPGGLSIASGSREVQPATPGNDIVLTIDREIQHVAAQAVEATMKSTSAIAATAVVMDAETFEILAMVSLPSFDPNHRDQTDSADWRNRAVTDVFEPGSSQKALTFAAAIEEGIVGPHTPLSVADRIAIADAEFTDIAPHPVQQLSVTQILERSSNVGTIMVARELGASRLDRYLRAFGYGARTALGFPGESNGLLRPHESWWGTSLPTIAIGQGVAVTLAQLTTAYAIIANDGVALGPSIVRGTVGVDGRLDPVTSAAGERVISANTAAIVRDMLIQAVEGTEATGNLAAIPGYRVGGKTGTASKPNVDAPGYSTEYVATFVGMAPAHDPKLVVGVMIDEPTPIFGGVVAAPLFREIMSAALAVRSISADDSAATLDVLIEQAQSQAIIAAEQEGPGSDDVTGGASEQRQ